MIGFNVTSRCISERFNYDIFNKKLVPKNGVKVVQELT